MEVLFHTTGNANVILDHAAKSVRSLSGINENYLKLLVI